MSAASTTTVEQVSAQVLKAPAATGGMHLVSTETGEVQACRDSGAHCALAIAAAIAVHQDHWRAMSAAETRLALLGLRACALAVREISPSAVAFATTKDHTGGQRTASVLSPGGQYVPLRERLEADPGQHLSPRSAQNWRVLSADTPPGSYDTVRAREARGGHDHLFYIDKVLAATADLLPEPAAAVVRAHVPAPRTSPEQDRVLVS